MSKELRENILNQIEMPPSVREIIEVLERAGYEAYAVGGCVRDACLGREAHDWDLTTSAQPMEVKSLFRRTVDTGIEHGTVTVMMGDTGYEVTTYRQDGEYEDARHPKQVTFTPDLREDLRRRDFTINAMAYNERTGVVDLFGGMEDLRRGVIRCVGDAGERFGEDALRILRAVRFSAQLGFSIEEETAAAAGRMAGNLARISAERIYTELCKMLVSDHPDTIRLACELGITRVILPEFDAMMGQMQNGPHHAESVGEHTVAALMAVRPYLPLRLTMLLHDAGKPGCAQQDEKGIWHFPGHAGAGALTADAVLKRLKSDRATQRLVHTLTAAHSDPVPETETQVRRMASRLGPETFSLYLEVRRADVLAQLPETRPERLRRIDEAGELLEEILNRRDPLNIGDLAVNGRDLMAAGVPKGTAVGRVLESLLEQVLEDPAANDREQLLERAKSLATNTEHCI